MTTGTFSWLYAVTSGLLISTLTLSLILGEKCRVIEKLEEDVSTLKCDVLRIQLDIEWEKKK